MYIGIKNRYVLILMYQSLNWRHTYMKKGDPKNQLRSDSRMQNALPFTKIYDNRSVSSSSHMQNSNPQKAKNTTHYPTKGKQRKSDIIYYVGSLDSSIMAVPHFVFISRIFRTATINEITF